MVSKDEWDHILDALTTVDCPHKQFYTKQQMIEHEQLQDEVFSLCDADLRKGILNPVGRINVFPKKLYKYLNNQIYMPLGYDVDSKTTFSELIKDAIFLNEDNSKISQNMMLPHNLEYKNNILEAFKNIQHYSTNFEDNKPQISDAILDLLKKFHIYWNVKRRRNEMDQVKTNTMDIIRTIINQYKKSEGNMRLTTLNILTNIKDAYFRFFRADKMIGILQTNPVEQVTVQILRRYKDNVDKIRMHESSYKTMIVEVGYLLELSYSFWKINYLNKIVDKQNRERFRYAIYDKIKEIYTDYQKYMIETGDSKYNDVKDFTVLILAKLEVKMHLIFEVYSFEGFTGQPKANVENELYSVPELYFKFMDQLVIIPERCLDMHINSIKDCLASDLSKILNTYYFEYWMFTSVNGAQLFDFLRTEMTNIIEQMDKANVWDNAINWKNLYFTELFKFDELFRMKYFIRKVFELDDLMNQIGYIIERHKGLQIMSKNHFKLLNKLDTDIYELFIRLKSDYNQFEPLNKHVDILNKIKDRIHNFLKKYVKSYSGKIGQRIRSLLNDISRSTENWFKKHCIKYVVNTSPNNKITPLDSLVPVPSHPGSVMQQIYHEPVVMSGATYPLGMGMDTDPQESGTPDGEAAQNNDLIPEVGGGLDESQQPQNME